MAEFKAIQREAAHSIQDTLAVENWFSELRQVGSFYHDEGVHAHTPVRSK